MFGGILFTSFLLVLVALPRRLNEKQTMTAEPNQIESVSTKVASWKIFFKNKRVVMAVVSSILSMIFMLFFESILSIRLMHMGIENGKIGYVFGLGALVYAVSAPFVGALCRVFKTLYIT